MANWYEAAVLKIEQQSPNTRLFTLKVLDDFQFLFKPGQFITLDLPIHEKRRLRLRSYSIANTSNRDNILELSITYLENGKGSGYLFNEVKEGHVLTFKGPGGVFTLPQKMPQKLVFICTGTGIAPFRSMLRYLAEEKLTTLSIHLIFGTRYADGILFEEEIKKMKDIFPDFTYSVALSRTKELSNVEGVDLYKGYLHDIYQKEYSIKSVEVKFLLCGWKGMIDEAVSNLKKMGYDERDVYYELYG